MSKNKNEWPAKDSNFAKAFEAFCRTVYKYYCPLHVHNKEYLPKTPFLICSNHTSHMDSSILMIGAGLSFQSTGLLAAKDYFFDKKNFFFAHYIMNLVPIERGIGVQAINDSVIRCREFLHQGGRALIIFPEGTRSKTGQMTKFKQGGAILAHNLDIPLVPAYIDGAFNAMPKGAFIFKPKNIQLSFGKPLFVKSFINSEEEDDRRAVFQAYRDATTELEARVKELSHKGESAKEGD